MSSLSERALAAELALAIERDRLDLVYQPKVALKDGAMVGAEALARWRHPRFGEIAPNRFVPAAERHGVIDQLTEWVLRNAFRQWSGWRDQGLTTCLSVNLSALTLRDLHFPDHLDRMCRIEGVPPDHVVLEITEGASQHETHLLDTLTRFRLKGFGLSLDDFGTGYSSLLRLRQLPYSELKIDRCFVRDVARSRESRLIVEAMIRLAQGLGLAATAEGVEDEATLALLQRLGCDRAQGYFVGRPMGGAELVPWWLERHDSATGQRAA
jgi:EAL domain-containing protein (putative c-di-GMP-specific phosphodiesterase class I)